MHIKARRRTLDSTRPEISARLGEELRRGWHGVFRVVWQELRIVVGVAEAVTEVASPFMISMLRPSMIAPF
jgi:hypothetical protein